MAYSQRVHALLIAAALVAAEPPQVSTEIETIGREIEALAPDADPAPLMHRIRAILDHSCCVHARAELDTTPDSALSLQDWWRRGGEDWLVYLPPRGDEFAFAVLPPDFRRTIADGPLVCSHNRRCDAEAEAAVVRAARVLRALDADNGIRAPWQRYAEDVLEPCEPAARKDYASAIQCLAQHSRWTTSLPLGHFQLPHNGWIVLNGRRGHYDFCDQVSAFDLQTGAAFTAESCSDLVLREGGDVDFEKTDAARKTEVKIGSVNVTMLRDAALILQLVKDAHIYRESDSIAISKTAARTPVAQSFHNAPPMVATTASTAVGWRWHREGKDVGHGVITWNDVNAADEYSQQLVEVAEESFVERCPPATLPPDLLSDPDGPGVDAGDASPAGVRSVRDQLRRLIAGATCTP